MPIVDLTHFIEPAMPIYPGGEPPRLEDASTVARNGFAEKRLLLHSHNGTHIDAPAHMLASAKTLDAFDIASFYGRAVLVDCRSVSSEISLAHLAGFESSLRNADFLILRTGWAERWGMPSYFGGYPILTMEAARWIVALGIKGIGLDVLSVDSITSSTFPVHHLLFSAGILIVENLANLDQVAAEFFFGCFPLKIKNADGAPVRAVAFPA
jgi:arylformamidase